MAIIVIGHSHWKSVINQNAKKAQAQVENLNTNDDIVQTKTDSTKTNTSNKKETLKESNMNIDDLTKLLPDDVKSKLVNAYNQHKQVNMVLAGGQAINGLSQLLQTQLNAAYGNDFIKVTENVLKDKTTLEVYQNALLSNVVANKPDIILFTPMLVNDQGKVSTRDSSNVPVLLGENVKETAPDTVFMIEPTNPVTFNTATNDRIDAVKTAAEDAGFDYIDHFDAWPTGSDLEADLDQTGKYPNAKGLKLWADFLTGYFTSQN